MKFFQKRPVAMIIMIVCIFAGMVIGMMRAPDQEVLGSDDVIFGEFTYVMDEANVLTPNTEKHIEAMNASLFAQTGAQILVATVDSTLDADIMDFAIDMGNYYGVGSAERNNGVVMLLALNNVTESGLIGDYCVVVGDGLTGYGDEFADIQYDEMESYFAKGKYDVGARAAFDGFCEWFEDYYHVKVKENYIPASSGSYSTSSGYHSVGMGAESMSSLVMSAVALIIVLLIIWVIVDKFRYRRYQQRCTRAAGMGIPVTPYYPVFWGRRRSRPVAPPPPPRRPAGGSGNKRGGYSGGTFHSGGSFGGGSSFGGSSRSSGGSRGGFDGLGFGGGSFGGSSSRSSGSSFGGSRGGRSSGSSFGGSSSRSSFGGSSRSSGSSFGGSSSRSSFGGSSRSSSFGGSRGGGGSFGGSRGGSSGGSRGGRR